jgi:TPR repeat protein
LANNEFEELVRKAEQGDAKAQYGLGLMYYNGEGVSQDAAKALYWWMKAAEQGHAEAQFNVGVVYLKGEGTPRNTDEALKWTVKAAEQGLEPAKNLINQGYIQKLMKAEVEMKDAWAEQYKYARATTLALLDMNHTPGPGRTYIANEDYDAAIREYRNRGDGEALTETLFLRGIFHKFQGKPLEAIADFEAVLAIRPDFVRAQTQIDELKSGQLG